MNADVMDGDNDTTPALPTTTSLPAVDPSFLGNSERGLPTETPPIVKPSTGDVLKRR